MTEAWLLVLFGVGTSMAGAALLWYSAKRCRLAVAPGKWSSEGTATFLPLTLFGLVVVGGAWTIKGAMFLVPDDVLGLVVGFSVVLVGISATLWLLGPLPSEVPRSVTSASASDLERA